jgi:hypothetical protein
MSVHSLINNDEAGEVEVFEGLHYACPGCHGYEIVRKGDETPKLMHNRHFFHEHTADINFRGWYYAWGSKGTAFVWETEPDGPYRSEAMALDAAKKTIDDWRNRCA